MTLYCHNCGSVIGHWELNDGKCPVCESGNVHPFKYIAPEEAKT